jgi:hypothetical protein
MVLMKTPAAMAIKPFIGDREDRPASNTKAKTNTEANSNGPNCKAIAANGASSKISNMSEIVSPETEE